MLFKHVNIFSVLCVSEVFIFFFTFTVFKFHLIQYSLGANIISDAVDNGVQDLTTLDLQWRLWDMNGIVMQSYMNMTRTTAGLSQP